ncbi:hypothetical protein R3P38DRAFT_2768697 [Favolaschia claudopus]|uniref:Transposase n=1 Tax=Favolaschia claudopus TaxID=2862362 RepID=A0AAW0CTD2_9AGAR
MCTKFFASGEVTEKSKLGKAAGQGSDVYLCKNMSASIYIPDDVKQIIQNNPKLRSYQLWKEILKSHPEPAFSQKAVYNLCAKQNQSEWRRTENELESAKILLAEFTKDSRFIRRFIDHWSLEIIQSLSDKDITEINALLTSQSLLTEVTLKPCCKKPDCGSSSQEFHGMAARRSSGYFEYQSRTAYRLFPRGSRVKKREGGEIRLIQSRGIIVPVKFWITSTKMDASESWTVSTSGVKAGYTKHGPTVYSVTGTFPINRGTFLLGLAKPRHIVIIDGTFPLHPQRIREARHIPYLGSAP